MQKYSILFICTANQIRSPIAETLLKNYLNRIAPDSSWIVESAGIWATNDNPVPNTVSELIKKRGLNMENHRSRVITPKLISEFNLILVMEQRHKEILKTEFPDNKPKIFMVSEMSNLQIDIRDPSIINVEEIIRCINEIDQWILNGLPTILEKLNYLP